MASNEKYTSVSVKQLKDRKGKPWRAVLKYKDEDNKWRETTKMLRDAKGKKEAVVLANAWKDEMNAAANDAPHSTVQEQKARNIRTVRHVIESYWEEQRINGELERSTLSTQKAYGEKHVFPYIGDVLFDELTPNQIRNWLTTLHKTLKPNSVGVAYSIVRKTYKHYFEIEDIKENPFDRVKPPKKGKPKNTHLDDAGMRKLETCLPLMWEPYSEYYTAVYISYYTGMRQGEVCGLRWRDINFARDIIHVRSAVGRIHMGATDAYTKEPKNDSSVRDIPLLPQLKEVLQERYKYVKNKEGRVDTSWFIVGIKDEFMMPQALSSYFSRFVRRYDIRDYEGEYFTYHGLRHSFATLAVISKMDIKSLASILGHAKADITLNVYASSDEDAKRAAMGKMADVFNEQEENDF